MFGSCPCAGRVRPGSIRALGSPVKVSSGRPARPSGSRPGLIRAPGAHFGVPSRRLARPFRFRPGAQRARLDFVRARCAPVRVAGPTKHAIRIPVELLQANILPQALPPLCLRRCQWHCRLQIHCHRHCCCACRAQVPARHFSDARPATVNSLAVLPTQLPSISSTDVSWWPRRRAKET